MLDQSLGQAQTKTNNQWMEFSDDGEPHITSIWENQVVDSSYLNLVLSN